MTPEGKFWIAFDALAALVVCTLILTFGLNIYASTRAEAQRVAQLQQSKLDAIKAGGDPLAVSCAFDGAGQLCAVLVAKKLATP